MAGYSDSKTPYHTQGLASRFYVHTAKRAAPYQIQYIAVPYRISVKQ